MEPNTLRTIQDVAKPLFGFCAGVSSTLALLNANLPPPPADSANTGVLSQAVHFARTRPPQSMAAAAAVGLVGLGFAFTRGPKDEHEGTIGATQSGGSR